MFVSYVVPFRSTDRNGVPVLGMFRPNAATLADGLTSFLLDVFQGAGRTIIVDGQSVTIVRDPEGGDFGDGRVVKWGHGRIFESKRRTKMRQGNVAGND